MNRARVMLITGSILAMTSVAFAGNKGGTFSVSPVIGGITFEGVLELETVPLFGGRLGYNFTDSLGIEALFDYSKTRSDDDGSSVDFYRYGGDLLYHFMPENKFVPYVAIGFGGLNFNETAANIPSDKTEGVFDYGLGAKYFVTEDVAWRADVRHLVNDEYQAVEYTIGLYIPFGGAPPIARLADPPQVPAPVAKPLPSLPPPAPLVKLTAAPPSVTRGETSTLTWTSKNATTCDIQPEVGSVMPNGSKIVTPAKDTLYVAVCNGEGGSAKSIATVTVTEPPVPVVPVVKPRDTPAAIRFCNKPAILMINFDVDKYNIKPQYHNELKSVGDFLKEFPESKGVIEGHTDSSHTRAYNQKLSELRANSVKEYIIKNFDIDPGRIASKGYGEDKPIATNKTRAGKAKNRRIVANFTCD